MTGSASGATLSLREWSQFAARAKRPAHSAWVSTSPKLRYIVVATFVTLTCAYLLLYSGASSFSPGRNVHFPGADTHAKKPYPLPAPKDGDLTTRKHPIDDLILTARAGFNRVLAKQSLDLQSAAKQYRLRRGRHPPPGFDKWFEYAQSKKSVVVEDFFDRIYHDLNPFWALDAKSLRYQSRAGDFVISVRNGQANFTTDGKKRVPWIQLWHDLIAELQEDLPDVDIPVNMMDESRLVVPWEEIDKFMKISRETKRMGPVAEVVTSYTGLAKADAEEFIVPQEFDRGFRSGQYWDLAKVGCHPDSPSRHAPAWAPLEQPTRFPLGQPHGSTDGFVSNWTLAKQICDKPWLRGLHGSFVEPISVSTTHKLIPLFGGSKLPVNNEILLPPATYLNPDPMYSGGEAHGKSWKQKTNNVLWRGVASGGRNKAESWTHFQRHRFVQMMNGTRVLKTEQTKIRAETFDLPGWKDYNLKSIRNGYLGEWLGRSTDVAFVHLICFPSTSSPHCPYTDSLFELRDGISMQDMYNSKYLPDIDGNSFSGRYRAFLLSTSLPIKATIYHEWHDDRLFPWLHFVPMDNTFVDIYAILEYFMGYDGYDAHDEMAQRIANDGKQWAEKVLRREDMAVYTYRLMLEWARICDDNRLKMGWVGDL